jgi:hypothetical protein
MACLGNQQGNAYVPPAPREFPPQPLPGPNAAARLDPDESADVTAVEPSTVVTEPVRAQRAGSVRLDYAPAAINIRTVLKLAIPTLTEQILFAVVGLTDTIIAGHTGQSPQQIAAASAAVGTMSYLQWFAGLMTAALGVGATAIVARSIGARRIRVANRVAGTSVTAALAVGFVVAAGLFAGAPWVVTPAACAGWPSITARNTCASCASPSACRPPPRSAWPACAAPATRSARCS